MQSVPGDLSRNRPQISERPIARPRRQIIVISCGTSCVPDLPDIHEIGRITIESPDGFWRTCNILTYIYAPEI